MKYRKRPVVVKARRWFKDGDHPEVEMVAPVHSIECPECKLNSATHGWVKTLEGGHRVCPGDWIITGVEGEHYPCKPDIFEETYERVEE